MDDQRILDLMMGVLQRAYPEITIHTEFEQIGADSQLLLDIILDVEKSFGQEFDADAFTSGLTPFILSRAFKPPPP